MPSPLLPLSSGSGSRGSMSSGLGLGYPNGSGSRPVPGSGSGFGDFGDFGAMPRSDRGLPILLRRLTKFKAMDFELAFWQLTYLVVAPRRVYKQTYHHKQTKNVWARDDPAMLILISGCLAVAGLAWSLVYRKSLSGAVLIILRMIFRDFLLTSFLVATLLYFISNRLLLSPSAPHSAVSENRVEWSYAFDVAVNSFFPAFLTTYVALLPLAAVVVRNNWVSLFFGNTLFLIAQVQWVYVMYLGIAALPFVARSEFLLAPLLPIVGGYLLSLLGFNMPRHVLELYFGQTWH